MASGPITSWRINGDTVETVADLYFWAPKSLQMMIAAMKLKDTYSLEGKLWATLDSILKSRDVPLTTNVHLLKAMVFPGIMYGCESWTVKKAESWNIDSFELCCWRKLLKSLLDCKEIQPVHLKDQSWVISGMTDAKVETPVLWSPHGKCWLILKDPDARRDWGQEEKGTTEDEMTVGHHQLYGHEFE